MPSLILRWTDDKKSKVSVENWENPTAIKIAPLLSVFFIKIETYTISLMLSSFLAPGVVEELAVQLEPHILV
jgi:hypothetical protein